MTIWSDYDVCETCGAHERKPCLWRKGGEWVVRKRPHTGRPRLQKTRGDSR